MTAPTLEPAEHCCCVVFRDEAGRYRIQRHVCCPQHWRDAADGR